MIDLHILGDVKIVLEGRVNKKNLVRSNLEDIAYALGAGYFEDKASEHVGEAIVFEDQASVYIPDQVLTYESYLETPFLISIARKPAYFESISESITLSKLYDELLESYPKGFAVVGEVSFSNLEGAFLKKAPIYGENINEHKKKYWQSECLGEKQGKIVGFVLPYLNDKAFYDNPNDAKTSDLVYSHTHVLVEGYVRHLLTHSTLEKAELWVEGINKD